MIHFVCYPKKKIETFVDVAKIKIPKNNKEAIDIFKNKINDTHNKFKGENIIKLNKNGKLIIPKTLQTRAVAWYHHYLQHPGHTRLEETLRSAMYWKNLWV